MGKYFGTDGIRGKANELLTPKFCMNVGIALGKIAKENYKEPRILIGRDTRLSGQMIQNGITSGLLSMGVDVYNVGVTTTPSLAYLVKSIQADFAIMISASHNPYYDNGIKIFNNNGFKISEDLELKIEEYLDNPIEYQIDEIGSKVYYREGYEKYCNYIKNIPNENFEGFKILIDCANGSTSKIGPRIFGELDAEITVVNNHPNGVNINEKCGSTNIDLLKKHFVGNGYDIAFSFDGDGDRVLVLDDQGNIVNGDHIMYLLGLYFKEHDRLKNDTIVITPMTNLGIKNSINNEGIETKLVDVGDKYVLEEIESSNLSLGGEQSGHIILRDYSTTGDGILTALYLLKVIKEKNTSLSQLLSKLRDFPQKLINIKTTKKHEIMDNLDLKNTINLLKNELGNKGRIFVRASGTEPLLRILLEAENDKILLETETKIMKVVNTII